jgi:hypothetical protein
MLHGTWPSPVLKICDFGELAGLAGALLKGALMLVRSRHANPSCC